MQGYDGRGRSVHIVCDFEQQLHHLPRCRCLRRDMCVSHARFSTVQRLLELGVVMMTRNIRGKTPLEIADEAYDGVQHILCRDVLLYAIERLRQKTIAFTMGQHSRLGMHSSNGKLSKEETNMILDNF
jgi:hypothetical protein